MLSIFLCLAALWNWALGTRQRPLWNSRPQAPILTHQEIRLILSLASLTPTTQTLSQWQSVQHLQTWRKGLICKLYDGAADAHWMDTFTIYTSGKVLSGQRKHADVWSMPSGASPTAFLQLRFRWVFILNFDLNPNNTSLVIFVSTLIINFRVNKEKLTGSDSNLRFWKVFVLFFIKFVTEKHHTSLVFFSRVNKDKFLWSDSYLKCW